MREDAPIIGITVDADEKGFSVARGYVDCVIRAGGTPIILPPSVEALPHYLDLCAGFVLTGGDDPRTEPFGEPTHPVARPVAPDRQLFETELLRALDNDRPALGVCLGMQMMALVAGGRLDQHLPDTLATHELHWGRREHEITGAIGQGVIHSHHRQAVTDGGSLEIIATAPDGVVEAIHDPARRFYLGVQWHPERTGPGPLGQNLFDRLIEACRR